MSDSIDYIDEVGREWTYAIRYRTLADENAALRKRVDGWEEEARKYASDVTYWRTRAEKAERRAEELDRIVKLTPDHHSCTGCGVILNCNGSHRDHEWECWKRAEKAEARAAKAERERYEARALLMRQQDITIDAYKNLDAALDWIEYDEDESIPPAGMWERIKALLEKRREARRG